MSSNRQKREKDANIVQQLQDFANDSANFFNKCAKPDRNEYMKILQACAMGFLVIGFIGYIIKLVFIPINNIILGA